MKTAAALIGVLLLTVSAGCTRPKPSAAQILMEILSRKAVPWPSCAECRSEIDDWESSRNGDLLRLQKGRTRFRVFVISKNSLSDAQAYVNLEGVILQSSYRTIPSPYNAMITAKVECSDEFKPAIRGAGEGRYISTAANPRLAFGVCEASEAGYLAGIRFYYDEAAKRALKIECFIPYLARENKKNETLADLDREMDALAPAMKNYRDLIPAETRKRNP